MNSPRPIAVENAAPPADTRRHYSIQTNLLALVAACVLPAILLAAVLVYQNYRLQRERVYNETVLLAGSLAAALDRELAEVQSGLRVLATSPDLASGNLAGFHQRARDALKYQVVTNYVMLDRKGHQRINTLQTYGTPLPVTGVPPEMQRIFDDGAAVVSGLFTGTLTGTPFVAIGVPVFRGDAVIYSLNGSMTPERVATVFNRLKIPDGWVGLVIDGTGTIITRSRDPEQFVGRKIAPLLVQSLSVDPIGVANASTGTGAETSTLATGADGIPVFTAFSQSAVSNWSVAVGAPKEALTRALFRSLAWVVTVAVLALGGGVWCAIHLANRISDSVQGLIGPALALGNGRPVLPPVTRLKEASDVGGALMQAARMLRRAQHLAHHDNLTGLCNRLLFDEMATHQLAIARRNHGPLAVLAIDLDGFKAVNDLHGHAAGDRVLKAAAERILSSLRLSDVAARLGGDEFAVLLSATDLNSARIVGEKLVAALAKPYPDIRPTVTASIGIAIFPHSGTTLDVLLDRADQALYEAKRHGKRCMVADAGATASAGVSSTAE